MRKKNDTQKAVQGTARKDRTVKLNPVVKADVAKPGEMTETERKVFDTIIEHLKENGTFKPVDVYPATQAARCIVMMEQASSLLQAEGIIQTYKTGAKQIAAELSAYDKAFSMFQKLSTMLGLDPKARSLMGITTDNQEAVDPIAELLKKHG